MKSNIFTKPIIALGSGIAMGLTVAPVGAWFLAWFAMIPLWLIVINSPKYPKQKSKSLSPSRPLPSPPLSSGHWVITEQHCIGLPGFIL